MSKAGVILDDEPTFVELTKESWLTTYQDNTLMGATLPQLIACLWPHRHEIEYRIFTPRLVFLFVVAIFNTFFAIIEMLLYSRAISQTKILPRPLFVLGHPRSGTTLLHNLLSLDEQFLTPNVFQIGFHSSFLTFERFCSYWPFTRFLSPTRPMDAIPLTWDAPCEDECATYIMSGGASPYMALHFLAYFRKFMPYISFKCQLEKSKMQKWKKAFLAFIRKLSYRSKGGQRLLLKSPCHTGRVSILSALFNGDVQFVVVHRHPEEIFQSSCEALVDKYYRRCTTLQRFYASDCQKFVLEQGQILQKMFEEDIEKIKPENVVYVSFTDLVNDPERTVSNVFNELGIPFTEEARERLARRKKEHKLYQRNKFKPLSREARALVQRQWLPMYTFFGYSTGNFQ